MDPYEIYNIIPKDGVVKHVHGTILGRRCWIVDACVGERGLLMVDVGDPEIGPHRIRLSVILYVAGVPGDPEVQIKTENTVFILRKTKENPNMIIRNAIRCNICGDEIESKHRNDFVTCKCGACSVDGGHDYLRRCFKEKGCFTDISVTASDDEQANQE